MWETPDPSGSVSQAQIAGTTNSPKTTSSVKRIILLWNRAQNSGEGVERAGDEYWKTSVLVSMAMEMRMIAREETKLGCFD